MRGALLVLLLTANAWANAPAPWAVCYGKKAGDSCSGLYYPFGKCVYEQTACRESKTCLTCRSRSGCQMGAGDAASGAALLGFVSLLLVLRRGARRAAAPSASSRTPTR